MDLGHDLKAAIRATDPEHPGRDALLRMYAANIGDPDDALPAWERQVRDEDGRFTSEMR